MEKLKTFNVFGFLLVRRERISATATAICLTDGIAIEKNSRLEFEDDPILLIDSDETCFISFAAYAPDREKDRIEVATNQISKHAGSPDVMDNHHVRWALNEVLRKVQAARLSK